MGWKPDMTDAQRAKLNRSRRRSYAKKRAKLGQPYSPRVDQTEAEEAQVSYNRLKELLRKLDNASGDGNNTPG